MPEIQIGSFDNVPDHSPLTSPWAQDITERVIHHFTTRAQRDAQWPDPPVGANCFVDEFPFSNLIYGYAVNAPGQRGWVGTIAAGIAIMSNGTGDMIVNFPSLVGGGAPFAYAPIVTGMIDLNGSGAWGVTYTIVTGYPNGAGMIVGARNSTGSGTSVRASSLCAINYFVQGPV